MAANGVPDIQHLRRNIQVTAKYPMAYGGYADIYPGIWRGGLALLPPGLWAGAGISGRNVPVAIKVFRDAHRIARTPDAQEKYIKRLNREYRVWAFLQHPNVLPLFGLVTHRAIPSTGIVSPHCSLGDLRAFFSTEPEANRLAIVRGIANGLAYVHGQGVVHGDLTMNNVLVEVINGNHTPLISDFGRSRVLEQAGYTSGIGNALHRHTPPEIMTADGDDRTTKAFTQAADVWCFGMVMLETLTGKAPFCYMSELQTITAVAYGNETPDQRRYPTFPHDNSCWENMRRCWHRDPSDREEMPRLLESLNALGL